MYQGLKDRSSLTWPKLGISTSDTTIRIDICDLFIHIVDEVGPIHFV